MDTQKVLRLSAFAAERDGALIGGNPAGVAILDALPAPEEMLRVAAEIGYSETAFLAPAGEKDGRPLWRVRYFAPAMEVPFCGHATIASGAALGERFGAGLYPLALNDGAISVEASPARGGSPEAEGYRAALQSPPTRSAPASADEAAPFLDLFGLGAADLDPDWPVSFAEGGARHLLLMLRDREKLAALGAGRALDYDLKKGAARMNAEGLITVMLMVADKDGAANGALFHARNAFASGGVAEDPATGAAAAAFAGLVRDLGRLPPDGRLILRQGEDMGAPSLLTAEATPEKGASIRVSGRVRRIA